MHDAKSSLSRLVKRAAEGGKIPWNLYKGKIPMSEDFDAPLEEFKDYL